MDLQEQYEKLLRYCCMLTGDRIGSEDIVQETFLRFWQSHTYKDTGKEMAYLYIIARNLCMDEFRKPKSEDIDCAAELSGGREYEPESSIERLDVEAALGRLPEEQRELLALRFINDLSVGEISKITGISRFAIYRRVNEGLALLKKSLGGEWSD